MSSVGNRRKVTVEVEVDFSRCAICGEEELAKPHEFHSEVERTGETRIVGDPVIFPKHGEVRVSAPWPTMFNGATAWQLCEKHLVFMRTTLAKVVADERARAAI